MKDKILHMLRAKPLFLYLLPVFFVLHGYTENYNFIPVKDALILTIVYISASVIISLLFWLLYRNFTKANLVAFFIMAFNLFFGSVHDVLKKLFNGAFITKYVIILPGVVILLILLIIFLKKSRSGFSRIKFYLNVLLVIIILADILILTGKIISHKNPEYRLPDGFTSCDTCAKPDIYFILADEYAGKDQLKTLFGFDNSEFLNRIKNLGFHVIPHSRSNYNYTPFSIASILNMRYLDLKGKDRAQPDLTYCYEMIKNNTLLDYVKHEGYQFYNYSVFDFEGQPARVRETFLPVKTRLITAQTFLHRFDKEIRFNFVSRFKSRKNLEILTYANKHNNDNIYNLTWNRSETKTGQPKFVYTHLMMPHYPYYFDKNGNERPFEVLQEGYQTDKQAYIDYLQYSNNKLYALVEHIVKSSPTPPVIVLMGDHGFRHFKDPVDFNYYFENLASVYLPGKNYETFPDTMTSVNFFRNILNAGFGQRLLYLKDSSSYLKD